EGRGVFDFARGGVVGAVFSPAVTTSIQPYLFYTRRIGLNRNRVIPIDAGARLTGKGGKYAIGVMNIQTGDEARAATAPTNFSVVRVKRDILKRSSIGAMVTNRSVSVAAPGSNQGFGVDAAFSFFDNVGIGAYWARTETPGVTSEQDSYQGLFDYGADRYGAHLEYLKVGDNFNPEIGFVARDNFRRTFGTLRFSPRPKSIKAVRKFTYQGNFDNFVSGGGALETRIESASFNAEFENSDGFTAAASREFELLVRPTPVAGVTFPAGSYQFSNATV